MKRGILLFGVCLMGIVLLAWPVGAQNYIWSVVNGVPYASSLGFTGGSVLNGTTANTVEQRNGTNAQVFRAYNTFTDASNGEWGTMRWNANVLEIGDLYNGTGSARTVTIGALGASTGSVNVAASGPSGIIALVINGSATWRIDADGNLAAATDNAPDIGLNGATRPRAIFLAQPSITAGSGTGVTVNDSGSLRDVVYKVTVTSAQFISNAVTHDLVIATLPAKTFLKHVLAEVTTAFACTAVCTSSTLSMTVGSTVGGNEYLISLDADAAAAQFGDAAAELGASLTEATVPTAIGSLGSWAGTQAINLRMTSGTGNLGNGTATNLSQGSVTFYVTTVKMP